MFLERFTLPSSEPDTSQNTNLLFFFRGRTSVGYTLAEHLPQFGFTTAVSYAHPALAGLAPVAVGQVLNSGVYPKLGIQFASTSARHTVFSWLVCETLEHPSIDWFLLVRYTFPLTRLLGVFAQVESLSTFPTRDTAPFVFTERLRLGLQLHRFQLGPGLDLSHSGRKEFSHSVNLGGFIRRDF